MRSRKPKAIRLTVGKHKLTPTLRFNVCKFLRYGVSIECAAEQEGIASPTFYSWLRRGRSALAHARAQWDAEHDPDDDPTEAEMVARIVPSELEFACLVAEVQRAYARAEAGYTSVIWQSSLTDWRAAAWWLERRRPQHYGSRTELTIEREDRAPAALTNEEIAAELSALGFVQATVVEAVPTANENASTADTPSPRKLGVLADGSRNDSAVVRGDDDTGRNEGG